MAKKTVAERRKSQYAAYGKALAAVKKDPHNTEKIARACELIPPAPPKKGAGK